MSLSVKLGAFVVLLFSAVIAVCLLWTPVRVRYYRAKYLSDDFQQCVAGCRGLLSLGERGKKGLIERIVDELENSTPKRKVRLVDVLLSMGQKGESILAEMMAGGSDEVELLTFYWKNWPYKDGRQIIMYRGDARPPLHGAARYGYTDAIKLFIARGAKIDDRFIGWTPLHIAVRGGYKDTVAFLIENGADLKSKDKSGMGLLHHAAGRGHEDIAALLIEKGAEVNSENRNGETPLHLASHKCETEIISILLANGANINLKAFSSTYPNGLTPLLFACRFTHNDNEGLQKKKKSIELLLKKGADPNFIGSYNKTASDWIIAESGSNPVLMKLLRSYGGKTVAELRKEQEKK